MGKRKQPFRAPSNLLKSWRAAAADAEFLMMIPEYPNYGLFKLTQPWSLECPGIGLDVCFTGICYAVRKKSKAPARSNRPGWGVPKCWQPYQCTESERPELGIKLYDRYLGRSTTYHRLVGQAILQKTYWDDAGRLLEAPRQIRNWKIYDVHHRNGCCTDQRVENLAIVSKTLHRRLTATGRELPMPEHGWGH